MKSAVHRRASLTRRLLLWVLAALLLVWAGFVAVGCRTGVHEAGELTDGHLAGTAALMLNLDLPPFVDAARETARPVIPTLKSHDYQPSLSVLVRDAGGRLLARSGDAPCRRSAGKPVSPTWNSARRRPPGAVFFAVGRLACAAGHGAGARRRAR